MPVLTTSTFNLPIDEIIDLGIGRVTGERTNGYDATQAVKLLSLVFQEMTVRGQNLWTVEYAVQALALSDRTYTLPETVIDIVNANLCDTDFVGNELTIPRWSRDSYAALVDKTTEGRPLAYYIDFQRDAPEIYLYPAPDKSTYEFRYWYIRKLYDVGRLDYNLDIPVRWLPAIISGLAYYFSRQNPKRTSAALREELRTGWETDFKFAAEADRDKSPLMIVFDASCYFRP